MSPRGVVARLLRSLPYVLYRVVGMFRSPAHSGVPPEPGVLDAARRVLVIRLDALGDFLMATPALRGLRARWPRADLDVLVQPGVAPLARGLPWIDGVETLPCNFLLAGVSVSAGVRRWVSTLRALRRRRYDVVVDFSCLFASAAASWATGAPIRAGFRRRVRRGYAEFDGFGRLYTHEFPPAEALHISEELGLLAGQLGAAADGGGWELAVSEEARREADRLLSARGIGDGSGPWVAVHPSAKWPPKRWSAASFAETLDLLGDRGWRALLVGGPEDGDDLEAVRGASRASPKTLWPPVSLEVLAALLERADVFLGNDSGPGHIAAAVGTPAVLIFGPTRPARCGPKGSPVTAIDAQLECSPCELYFTRDHCRRGHNYCMDELRPSSVAAAVELAADVRKRNPPSPGIPSPSARAD